METTELKEPLRCKKGQTFEEEFEFFDEDDNPVVVTDYTFSLKLKERKDSVEVTASATCTITASNKVKVVVAASLTNGLKVRSYFTDLRGTRAGGIVDFFFEGEFVIDHAITQS